MSTTVPGAFDLSGQVALVTGSSSELGIGFASARLLGQLGASVMVTGTTDRAVKRADELQREGITASSHTADLMDPDAARELVQATEAAFGKVDILVNNAGISGSAVNDLLETGIWHRVMEVNSTGVFLGTAAAVPQMQKNGGGSIVNLSSISGVVGQTMVHMAYNASKGAVRTMTKATAVQFGKDNIRCNSIHPGLMPPMRTSGATADPTVRAKMLRAVPLGRTAIRS